MSCTTMLIFVIFVIFVLSKTNADELKIYQNKNIHWKRHCEKKINDKDVPTGYSCEQPKNAEMKYMVDSPHTSAIGKLVKQTKIEGCKNIGGCNLILKLIGIVSKYQFEITIVTRSTGGRWTGRGTLSIKLRFQIKNGWNFPLGLK